MKIQRPLDKLLYAPMRTQNQSRQAARLQELAARRQASSVRPEKRNVRTKPA